MNQKYTTSLERKRKQFAEKLSALLSEMDLLLIEEASSVGADKESIAEILQRKLHIGGLPFPIRIHAEDNKTVVKPNSDWVTKGYFNSIQVERKRPVFTTKVIDKKNYRIIIGRNSFALSILEQITHDTPNREKVSAIFRDGQEIQCGKPK